MDPPTFGLLLRGLQCAVLSTAPPKPAVEDEYAPGAGRSQPNNRPGVNYLRSLSHSAVLGTSGI